MKERARQNTIISPSYLAKYTDGLDKAVTQTPTAVVRVGHQGTQAFQVATNAMPL